MSRPLTHKYMSAHLVQSLGTVASMKSGIWRCMV